MMFTSESSRRPVLLSGWVTKATEENNDWGSVDNSHVLFVPVDEETLQCVDSKHTTHDYVYKGSGIDVTWNVSIAFEYVFLLSRSFKRHFKGLLVSYLSMDR